MSHFDSVKCSVVKLYSSSSRSTAGISIQLQSVLTWAWFSCRCVEQMVTSSDDYLICLSQIWSVSFQNKPSNIWQKWHFRMKTYFSPRWAGDISGPVYFSQMLKEEFDFSPLHKNNPTVFWNTKSSFQCLALSWDSLIRIECRPKCVHSIKWKTEKGQNLASRGADQSQESDFLTKTPK